ncbi:MAG TPA: PDZ domain-containing protein [Pirellulaceae bacterium]
MTNTKRLTLLAAALTAATFPLMATGQDDVLIPGGPIELIVEQLNPPILKTFNVVLNEDDDKADNDESSATEYWLGVQVAVVPELAKRQLAIDHGLAVEDVSPDSPAAKAEIKKYDILLQAGDTQLKGVGDLIKSVEAAKGKQIIIILKRDGQSKQVEAVAEQKAKADAVAEFVRRKIEIQKPKLAAEMKQLEEAMEKLKSAAGKEGFGMWFAKPAIVSPRVDVRFKEETTKALKADFPKDLSVQINKQGAEPTKIHVKRKDQEWEVTEDKLGDLPEDVRTHVQKMLGHMKGPTVVANADRKIWLTPDGKIAGEFKIPPMPPMPPRPAAAPVAPVPPVPPAAPAKPVVAARTFAFHGDSDTNTKLDAIMKKLDKLEKEIDELRDKK